jgi:hypothetical protein
MMGGAYLLSARAVRVLDIAALVWCAVWAAAGVLVWHDIRVQSGLSENVIKIGAAVRETGEALGVVGGLPLVGGGIADFADRITSSGAEVESSGVASRGGIARIAAVSGLAVGILPAVMVLLLYLPARLAWRRDVSAVAAQLARSQEDATFERYLARRACMALSWDRLEAIAADPWREADGGDPRALADAELERLGLSRPARRL